MRLVIQSLDCLNIHRASTIDDKDVVRDAESNMRGGGGGMKADRGTYVMTDRKEETQQRQSERGGRDERKDMREEEERG